MTIKQFLRECLLEQYWTIGFIEEPLSEVIKGSPYSVKYVKGMPKDRWFADPFILEINETSILLLVEEFCYKIHRGRIACLTIDKSNFQLIDYKIVLDKKTHLSFPFVLRKDGKCFVIPENSESGKWSLYEFNTVTNKLEFSKTLIDKPLTDAVIVKIQGKDLVFSTQLPNQNKNILFIYTLDGEYVNSIEFDSNIARNAGGWIHVNGKCYRPAQDCNGGYGRAVIIQEVDCLGQNISFTNVRRIESDNPRFTTGCHTLNEYKGLTVIDVHGWRRPLLAKLYNSIQSFKRYLR